VQTLNGLSMPLPYPRSLKTGPHPTLKISFYTLRNQKNDVISLSSHLIYNVDSFPKGEKGKGEIFLGISEFITL